VVKIAELGAVPPSGSEQRLRRKGAQQAEVAFARRVQPSQEPVDYIEPTIGVDDQPGLAGTRVHHSARLTALERAHHRGTDRDHAPTALPTTSVSGGSLFRNRVALWEWQHRVELGIAERA
jgi:hypothetical protein